MSATRHHQDGTDVLEVRIARSLGTILCLVKLAMLNKGVKLALEWQRRRAGRGTISTSL